MVLVQLFFKNCILTFGNGRKMKKKIFLKNLIKIYIKYSIHVALAVVALSIVSAHFLQVKLPFKLLIFIFSSTLLGYNFVKFTTIHHYKLSEKILSFSFLFLNGLATVALVITFFTLNIEQRLLTLTTSFLVLLYGRTFPFQQTNLRNQQGMKLYWVALCWVIITVGLPYLEAYKPNIISFLFWSFQVGIYVIVASLPFEIRDMYKDDNSLKTWPQQVGVHGTKKRGYGMLIAATLLLLLFPNVSWVIKYTTILTQLLLFIFLWNSSRTRTFYYSSFWVEALPLFWLLCVEVFSYLSNGNDKQYAVFHTSFFSEFLSAANYFCS